MVGDFSSPDSARPGEEAKQWQAAMIEACHDGGRRSLTDYISIIFLRRATDYTE